MKREGGAEKQKPERADSARSRDTGTSAMPRDSILP
jgi:hypothetical protein